MTGLYRITKRTVGRIVVTNDDPSMPSNDERMRLNDETQQNLDDELMVESVGAISGANTCCTASSDCGAYNVIGFLGRAMKEESEYDVPRDPRTPATSENPIFMLRMTESDAVQPGADRAVKYGAHYYAVSPEAGYQWNRKAFLLYQLFEMTVVKMPQGAEPTITIAR
jgi:hypothetical protein